MLDSLRNIALVLVCLAGWCPGANAVYDIPQSVIAGGGGTSASGTYSLTGTIGQSVTGISSGGTYSVSAGFWGGGTAAVNPVDITINVVITGSGSGTVTSSLPGINCPSTCGATFNAVTSVTLTATPANAGWIFTGWLGACTGLSTCTISAAGTQNVTAVFAPNNIFALRLDADENGSYDALTDGLLILRYLMGRTGTALTAGAIGPGSPYLALTPTDVLNRLNDMRPLFDIDGDGQLDPFTDGFLVLRYMLGVRGSGLIADAIAPGATRQTAPAIESHIQSLLP